MNTLEPRGTNLSEHEEKTCERLDQFKELVRELMTQVRSNGSSLSTAEREQLRTVVTELLYHFEASQRDESIREESKEKLIEHFQREFMPYLMLSENGRRWYEKPEGYAGDHRTMRKLYTQDVGGVGMIGTAIDRTLMDIPPAAAVRNRRQFLRDLLGETIESVTGSTSVMSLACGPSVEVFDVLEEVPENLDLEVNLLDMDPGAIQSVEERIHDAGGDERINTFRRNLIFIVRGRHELAVESQDLIYSAGLIDYFERDFVVDLLDWGYEKLKPGGRMVLGNFDPRNPNRAFMDEILRWELYHRTEEDMHELSRASKFDQPCTNIWTEEHEINLFAEYTRGGSNGSSS